MSLQSKCLLNIYGTLKASAKVKLRSSERISSKLDSSFAAHGRTAEGFLYMVLMGT